MNKNKEEVVKSWLRLRQIIVDVRDGKLEHNQRKYHCGTAHCIAGWYTVFKLRDNGYSTTFDEQGRWFNEETGEWYLYPPINDFAVMEDLGIYDPTGEIVVYEEMFHASLTLEQIIEGFNSLSKIVESDEIKPIKQKKELVSYES